MASPLTQPLGYVCYDLLLDLVSETGCYYSPAVFKLETLPDSHLTKAPVW